METEQTQNGCSVVLSQVYLTTYFSL